MKGTSDKAAPRATHDAIVFIPGVSRPWEGSVVEGLGERLVVALERNAPAPLRFSTSQTTETFADPFGVTPLVKVSVSGGGDGEASDLVDLYCLDAAALLKEPYEATSTMKKVLHLGFHIITLTPRVVFHILDRDQSFRAKLQLVFAGAMILLMQLSLLILLATLAAGFATLAPVANDRLDAVVDWALPFAAAMLTALAIIPKNIRSGLNSLTVFVLSFVGYVSAGIQRDAAIGKLASLLECLEESGQYGRVHIVSFGIGATIAIDSLYSRGHPILRFKAVDTLVTIACPADIILNYWPNYFMDRQRLEGVPRRWMNIFVPSDLMASNFIDGNGYDESPEEAQRRKRRLGLPRIRRPSWSGIWVRGQSVVIHPDSNVRHALTSPKGGMSFVFAAVRAHEAYWDRTSITASSVFDTIAQQLLPAWDGNLERHITNT